MIAAKLWPYYAAQAKERRKELSGTRSNPGEVPEKILEPQKSRDSRDEAGKAAGVRGRGFDDARCAWIERQPAEVNPN